MFIQMTLEDLFGLDSSRVLEDGKGLYSLPTGRQTEKYGMVHVPASPSVWPAWAKAPTTSAICGRSSDVSLRTATLQSSLESRLRARMDVNGSPEYVLTWKHWDMALGVPICALRASQRRTSGKDCSGWPSPAVQNADGGPNPLGNVGEHFTLQTAAVMAGWPTPRHGKVTSEELESWQKRQQDGKVATMPLGLVAQIAGWCSPMAQDGSRGGMPPRPHDTGVPLSQQAALAGWATPSARDHKSDSSQLTSEELYGAKGRPLSRQAWETGATTGYPAAMEKRGVLNPDLPRWLMQFPAEWLLCAPTETCTGTTARARPKALATR
jgi:hypothetical protein